jgi:hypothetical protein
MRSQYHFRMSPQGLCAWDIKRVAELSSSLPRERVPLSAIRELDEGYWNSNGWRPMTCRDVAEHARLILDSDLAYPIILFSDGRVMDGMHRVCKALVQGLNEVEAVRFLVDPKADYIGVQPDDLPYQD